jgi:hypothetical protein
MPITLDRRAQVIPTYLSGKFKTSVKLPRHMSERDDAYE